MNNALFQNARMPRSFGDLAGDFDRLFGQVFRDEEGSLAVGFSPRLDVAEEESGWHLWLDLPGVKSENLNLEVENGRLTIAGTRSITRDGEKTTYHRTERYSGEFTRSITLPKGVDAEGVSAELEDGVLHVWLPKRPEEQPRKIKINAKHVTNAS